MQLQYSTWMKAVRGLAALALLAACAVPGCSPPSKTPPPQLSKTLLRDGDSPKTLPKEIAQAWRDAGARVGWMKADDSGFLYFLPEEDGVAGDLPVFRFSTWTEGVLAKLPAPTTPFGLYLPAPRV